MRFYPSKYTKIDWWLMDETEKEVIKMIRKNSCSNITDEEFLNI